MNSQIEQNLLQLVKDNYQVIAHDFDVSRKKVLWPEVSKLAANVSEGDSVLDVGCGNGRLLNAFNGRTVNYCGTDSCQELLDLAKINYPHQANNFQLLDILELEKLKQNNFDWIFCVGVLHHLPGQRLQLEALKQLANKIKPGGQIIISTWNMWNQSKFLKLIFKYFLRKLTGRHSMDFGDIIFYWTYSDGTRSKRYYHAFTMGQLKRFIRLSGLTTKKIYYDKFNYYLVMTKN